jgi:hypothetical protein
MHSTKGMAAASTLLTGDPKLLDQLLLNIWQAFASNSNLAPAKPAVMLVALAAA